ARTPSVGVLTQPFSVSKSNRHVRAGSSRSPATLARDPERDRVKRRVAGRLHAVADPPQEIGERGLAPEPARDRLEVALARLRHARLVVEGLEVVGDETDEPRDGNAGRRFGRLPVLARRVVLQEADDPAEAARVDARQPDAGAAVVLAQPGLVPGAQGADLVRRVDLLRRRRHAGGLREVELLACGVALVDEVLEHG